MQAYPSKTISFTLLEIAMEKILIIPFVLLGIWASNIFQPQPVRAISSTIVISEFRTRGPAGGNDEFIELFNLSLSTVDLSGWEIRGSNSDGTVTTRAIITNGVALNPGCHFLLTNSNTNGYSDRFPGNQTYGVGITDDGGIALVNASGTIIDQVGMSSGSVFKEGITLAPLTSSTNRSYERRPGGAPGSTQDTDDNQNDFRLLSPSQPQNALADCIGTGTQNNPSGLGAASPSTVMPGANTLLTVTVSPGINPPSIGLGVIVNLSSIGGSSFQQFFNNGTNGDVTAGDNVFSFRASIAETTLAGARGLPATITDLQGRQGSATIDLIIEGATIKPQILSASLSGKKLFVTGLNFAEGAVILIDGEQQKTRIDDENPSTRIIGKKAGKNIAQGQTVTLQIRLADGTLSDGFLFTKP
jgi:hypothetical protein